MKEKYYLLITHKNIYINIYILSLSYFFSLNSVYVLRAYIICSIYIVYIYTNSIIEYIIECIAVYIESV